MVRYYGHYTDISRGKRKKKPRIACLIPFILEPESSSKEYRKNWARLIQKVYEINPLTCPKFQGRTKTISFIEIEEVIEKILKHLGLWEVKAYLVPMERCPFEYSNGLFIFSDFLLYFFLRYP